MIDTLIEWVQMNPNKDKQGDGRTCFCDYLSFIPFVALSLNMYSLRA